MADAPVALPGRFPQTRYRGSKLRLLDWIVATLAPFWTESVLDAFGGTGAVSYRFKQEGKAVTYNDLLPCNFQFGRALIENTQVQLSDKELTDWLLPTEGKTYPTWIKDTFADIYFTDEENAWLDRVVTDLNDFTCDYKKAIAFFALAQACISKRPFNLFHRKNLYLRTSAVERTFGNKSTWDRPFPDAVRRFVDEANQAIFSGAKSCVAVQHDAAEVPGSFDLVYADPPYISKKGTSTDYADLYHFLNGICDYDAWPKQLDHKSKHRRLLRQASPWTDKQKISDAFDTLFGAYPGSVLAVSYRSDGIPSIDELSALMKRHRAHVEVHPYGAYQYALSTNKSSEEVLLVGYDK
ncbi:MAG: DNA methyltransferase [Deltaproteobacteria bacterium]|nr:MAG: DNA methyltransferase [Deltaproteobacteria bacterium]